MWIFNYIYIKIEKNKIAQKYEYINITRHDEYSKMDLIAWFSSTNRLYIVLLSQYSKMHVACDNVRSAV